MSIDIAKLEPSDLIFQYIGTDVTEPKAIRSSHAMIFAGAGWTDLGDLTGEKRLEDGTVRLQRLREQATAMSESRKNWLQKR